MNQRNSRCRSAAYESWGVSARGTSAWGTSHDIRSFTVRVARAPRSPRQLVCRRRRDGHTFYAVMNPPPSRPPYLQQDSAASAVPGGAAAEQDDASLLRRMAEGDEQALGVLYDRWSPIVHGGVARLRR